MPRPIGRECDVDRGVRMNDQDCGLSAHDCRMNTVDRTGWAFDTHGSAGASPSQMQDRRGSAGASPSRAQGRRGSAGASHFRRWRGRA